MSIHFFETSPEDQRYLTDRLSGEILRFHSEPLTRPSQIKPDADNIEIVSPFVHSHLGADTIDALPHLELIATRSTGFDHINVPTAASRGIRVCNVPTYGENTVAEHTFALILALSRNLHKAYVRTSAGDFSHEGLQGFDLKGKTIGVVGTGHIGLHVVRIARGFSMNVLAYDSDPNPNAAEVMGYAYVGLEELLNRSDIVTLHAPLTPATHHLIGEHNIEQFKPGALLINTARGGLVDTQALLYGLDNKILRGAGLDVIEGEEVFSEEKQLFLKPDASEESLKSALRNLSLLRRQDLVITPHIAFDSREAVERILDTTVSNIKAFRHGTTQNEVHA